MYSLEDMCSTRAGLMVPALTRVFTRGLDHVTTCQLCQARGHICTICNSDHVIFPFMVRFLNTQVILLYKVNSLSVCLIVSLSVLYPLYNFPSVCLL